MIMSERTSYLERKAELKAAKRKTAKPLLYTAMVSIVMLFAGLTSAYIVRADSGNWLLFELPPVSILSTAVIVCSSLTMLAAQRLIKQNKVRQTAWFVLATLVLGIVFYFTQIEGWRQLTAQGIYFVGRYSNAAGSFLYLIALVHLLHMSGGIIALAVTFVKAKRSRYSAEDHLGIDLTAIYWHFLDLLWLYLFFFLYFYR
jgi:cytochrome c oxidase subunit 3